MLVGRSGSGKTTLAAMHQFPGGADRRHDRSRRPTVEADPLAKRGKRHREEIRQIRLRAGMLFQDFNLFPHMTVIQNCIEAPMRVLGLSRDEAVARAERLSAQGRA